MQTGLYYLTIYHKFCSNPLPCVTNIPFRKSSCLGKICSPLASLACYLGFYRSQEDLEKTINAIFRTLLFHGQDETVLQDLDTCISHLHHLKLQLKTESHITVSIDRILEHIRNEYFSKTLTN